MAAARRCKQALCVLSSFYALEQIRWGLRRSENEPFVIEGGATTHKLVYAST